MKCPNCGYEHRHITWSADGIDCSYPDGELGGFYQLPIDMQRDEPYCVSKVGLQGCPKCGNVFLDITGA